MMRPTGLPWVWSSSVWYSGSEPSIGRGERLFLPGMSLPEMNLTTPGKASAAAGSMLEILPRAMSANTILPNTVPATRGTSPVNVASPDACNTLPSFEMGTDTGVCSSVTAYVWCPEDLARDTWATADCSGAARVGAVCIRNLNKREQANRMFSAEVPDKSALTAFRAASQTSCDTAFPLMAASTVLARTAVRAQPPNATTRLLSAPDASLVALKAALT
mmetsp:Transcript_6411/g.14783  ORF Transcript_6411/g.14783 Transcript_6411/m.14783 type:complete len:219 (-) Transcript_6411:1228-1884(-)